MRDIIQLQFGCCPLIFQKGSSGWVPDSLASSFHVPEGRVLVCCWAGVHLELELLSSLLVDGWSALLGLQYHCLALLSSLFFVPCLLGLLSSSLGFSPISFQNHGLGSS